ncbi:hypothetical protein CGJ28_08950 [Vibrio parahaemolyticus]|nr:hypothetical protein CGJ41_22815 [Vibrio parahaemolyticus]TOF48214.1 hypothetical protein CGJ28_08950 [Vibrio parahaemolyticus]
MVISVADLISLGSFSLSTYIKMKKKEQNDDELLFWSLLFIWGTSGEVLEKCFFYIEEKIRASLPFSLRQIS